MWIGSNCALVGFHRRQAAAKRSARLTLEFARGRENTGSHGILEFGGRAVFVGDKRLIQFIAFVGLSFALSIGSPSASRAEDAAPAAAAADAAPKALAKEPEPTTTKDPQIALDDLELLLAPMTKEETETEAKGWFALLRAKEREITAAELDVRRKNREIAQLEKQKTAAADLAKATSEIKAAGDTASDKDKEAAAQHLAEAQKNLAKTVETAKKETVKEEKKAEAATAAMTKQAEAAPPPKAMTDFGDSGRESRASRGRKRNPAESGRIRREEIRDHRRHGKGRKGGRGDGERGRRRGPNQDAG